MRSDKMHGLLRRQLKKHFADAFAIPDEWRGFIDMINSAYYESDADRNMLERSLELSSQELLQANSEMRAIFEAVPDIFFRVDEAGTILDCKTGNTSDLLAPRQNLIGKKIQDIPLAGVAHQFQKALEDSRKIRETTSFEYSLRRREKECFYEARFIPLLENQAIVIIRNITDRKTAEQALKKSEEYYREITMNASDVLFIVDAKGDITYVSPSVERVAGWRPDELIGKNSLYLIVPDDQSKASEDFVNALMTRDVSIPNSFRIRHKNGTELVMEGVGKNLLHHPTIAGFVMNVRDVTDRKRTEEELRDSETKLQGIFSQIDTGIMIIDQATQTIIDANPRALEMSGFPGEKVIGQICHSLVCPAEKGKCPVKDMGQAVDQSERKLLHADGSQRDILKTVHPITIKGRACYLESFIDISDRKQAEATLKENERIFRLLTEKMTDIVWITDMNLKTVYVTPSIKTILGFTQEERMRQTVDQQLTPESLSYGLDAMMGEFAIEEKGYGDPNRSASLVLEYYHKDGSTRWMETIISGLRNDQGVLMGLHGVSRDITQRKLAEEKLRESQELYTKLVDALPDVIVRTDLEGKILFVNDYAFQINGYRRNEIEGQNILQYIAPEDQEAAFQNLAHMMEGKVVPHEYNLLTKDGRRIPFEMNGNILRHADGTPFGVVVVGRNISERKRSESIIKKNEERYRTIFESTATANIIMAEDTTILMANNHFASLCGYTKQEMEGKMSWTVFIHKDDLEKMKTYNRMRRIDPQSVPSAYEFRFINRKGEMKELFLSVALIPETNESIASLVDLTDRKQLETQLIQSQKMESVGRLAGGVAHDFNNMLSVIIGNTEMAMKHIQRTNPLYRTLQDVLNAGMRSSDLTRQLLAFARKQTVSPKVLDLNDTVAGMLKMLQRLIGEDIDLGWHPGRKLWKVKIDPSQVDQLLANLMVNARDAIKKTGRINIETSNVTCDEVYCADRAECVPGDYVVLAVSDNGCGMDKETQANIFEPFFTTKKEGQGTGLGLATVYGIIKQNSGFINVYSEPGQGSTFKIYLPRHMEETAAETDDDQPEPELQGGTETVMLVEDSETVLKLCKAMLETLGYKVLAANGKDQALRLAGDYSGKIDLLLTDVVMPEMNGKELSERILAMKPGLKCLYMSGYTADVIARQGILEEGIHFISKPFSLKDLAAKVRDVLDQ